MNRFIIATDDLSSKQTELFIESLQKMGVRWWHHMNNLWLLVSEDDALQASDIRDKLVDEIAPGLTCLVFKIEAGTIWSGYGPNRGERSMFSWIKKNWRATVYEDAKSER